jgi:outer membrane lipoprotein
MMKRPALISAAGVWVALCSVAVFVGCTPVISPQLMDQVDRALGYRAIAADPAGARGKTVLLGGTIVQTVPKPGLTEIDVVQKSLDSSGAPRLTDRSEGRFLVVSEQFLDPAVYSPGRDITVAGEVLDPQTHRIGEIDYRYPVIHAIELRLWRPLGPPDYPYPYGGPYGGGWRRYPFYPY